MVQMTLFDGKIDYVLTKPVRLISLFSGYDSQALALKYLGVPFEHWRTCEWAVKSIQALKDLHFANDHTDYSKDLSDEDVVNELTRLGISANYNEPMSKDQIRHRGGNSAVKFTTTSNRHTTWSIYSKYMQKIWISVIWISMST